MKELFKKLVVAFLFLAAVPVFAQTPSDKDLEKNNGSSGTPPVATPSQAVTNQTNLKPLEGEDKPYELSCGSEYEVEVNLSQEVDDCSKFDFEPLFQEALDLAAKRISYIHCPAKGTCEPRDRHTWFSYLHTGCSGETLAVAQVKEWVTCPNEGATLQLGWKVPPPAQTHAAFSKGTDNKQEKTDNGEYIVDKLPSTGSTLGCGTTVLASYTYEVETPMANALEAGGGGGGFTKTASFKPYYEQAVSNARTFHDSFKCKAATGQKCKLDTFSVLYSTWQANGGANTVTIVIYFNIACVNS